jgi:hypothetical protein
VQRKHDLVILTAGKDAEYGIRSVLENRRNWLAIPEIRFQCVVHPRHDSGVRLRSAEFLRGFLKTHEKALAIFDLEGSGAEDQPVDEIERRVEDSLTVNGWQNRCAAIILVPELESWIWDESLNARKAANLSRTSRETTSLLISLGFLVEGQTKPARPKEAFEVLLRRPKPGVRRLCLPSWQETWIWRTAEIAHSENS